MNGNLAYAEFQGRSVDYLHVRIHIASVFDGKDRRVWEPRSGLTRIPCLALSPRGGHLALIQPIEQQGEPRVTVLEIWDIATGERTLRLNDTSGLGFEYALSWSSDGEQLAFVRRMTEVQIPSNIGGRPEPSERDEDGRSSGVIHILDMSTHKERPLVVGDYPLFACDGRSLFATLVFKLVRVDCFSGAIIDADTELPGSNRDWIVAHLPGDFVLYPALPTAGSPPSPSPTLKVARLGESAFASVVPYPWMSSYHYSPLCIDVAGR